ncbi:hypothetical protein [Xanthomonas sp. XNM01]|uniref:hypothetical protein n=1 Tax=Xanthomonas sp. XNM01 TaxID=2769289 RepID=UPI001CE21846|nr:hypothetical protein [Xanthomonas sp. XNM01]
MVRAILSGQKTQTRRAVKRIPWRAGANQNFSHAAPFQNAGEFRIAGHDELTIGFRCPYGQPGDRLWVRETHAIFPAYGQRRTDGERWGPWGGLPTTVSEDGKQIAYYREGFDRCDPGRWRPSIHMPRWACRLVLEITNVRVERLQAISPADALAEGAMEWAGEQDTQIRDLDAGDERIAFSALWDSTGGDWDSNPWVWVIEFQGQRA